MVAARRRFGLPSFVITATTLVCVAFPSTMYGAAGPDETPLDALALVQMEHRVDLADRREQCYLYAEVLHGLTELAGRQIAANQVEEASLTLRQMEAVALKVQQTSAGDAKRLKDAEQLLEHSSHRFADMVRAVSWEDRSAMQKTLQRLNALHTEVLARVFAR